MLKLIFILIIIVLPTRGCLKKIKTILQSALGLWNLFSLYLNVALLESSFDLEGGTGFPGGLSQKNGERKAVPSPLVKRTIFNSLFPWVHKWISASSCSKSETKRIHRAPNARNAAWLMKRGRHNPICSFLKTTLKWTILARKLKQCTGLNHHQSYSPWFSRVRRHFAIGITKHCLCIFW